MTRVPELLALAQRCEEATGPDREIDIAICKATRPDLVADLDHCNKYGLCHSEGHFWDYRRVQFTASFDAALSLVPGSPQSWSVASNGRYAVACVGMLPGEGEERKAATPALALCAAALRALAALDQPA